MKLASIDRISVLNIHYINYSLDYFLDCQQALGVKNVELLAGRQDMWLDHKGSIDPKIIKKKLDDRGLKCPVITPDNCMLGSVCGEGAGTAGAKLQLFRQRDPSGR